jgi:hypothetical protein
MTHAEYDEDKWKADCGCYEPPPPKPGKTVKAATEVAKPTKRKITRNLTVTSKIVTSKTVATKTQFRLKGKSRDSYMELVLDFPLASIKSDEHLAEAQRVMDSLLARGTLDTGEETYLDALSDLVGSYED